jgi:AcrR family transcriptional regulator
VLLEHGYHGVGLEAVAQAAGVSRQTVYDQFGSKIGLLTAMIARSEEVAGLPARLAVVRQSRAGDEMLRAWLDTVAAVEPQVYPYSRLLYAARLDDPAAAELWRWRLSSRRAGLRVVMERLAAERRLRPGMRSDEAADLAWALTSPHQYEYLVVESGWSIERYRAHLEDAISKLLLTESSHGREPPQ